MSQQSSPELLQQLSPSAWTNVLAALPTDEILHVEAVATDRISRDCRRYILTLENYGEDISLIACNMGEREALFYRDIAKTTSGLAKRPLYIHLDGDNSWAVFSETPPSYPPVQWDKDDVGGMVHDLVVFHSQFWEQESDLAHWDWLPYRLAEWGRAEEKRSTKAMNLESNRILLSGHSLRNSGALAKTLQRAAVAVNKLRAYGGWEDVLTDAQLQAMLDLLDDPLPMLRPLREQPTTLTHGNLATKNWTATWFDERRLSDWGEVSIAPAVCDLVSFAEQFPLISAGENGWELRPTPWPVTRETIVDDYIIAMKTQLGQPFDSRTFRQAIPAAHCLFVITHWLPQLAGWLEQMPDDPDAWRVINRMSDQQLANVSYGFMAYLKPHLSDLFHRFIISYWQL